MAYSNLYGRICCISRVKLVGQFFEICHMYNIGMISVNMYLIDIYIYIIYGCYEIVADDMTSYYLTSQLFDVKQNVNSGRVSFEVLTMQSASPFVIVGLCLNGERYLRRINK